MANGRTRADRTIGTTTASDVATIDAASNRLTELRVLRQALDERSAGVLAKSFAHTPGGAMTGQGAAGVSAAYGYDARGRLATVTQAGLRPG